MHCKTLQHRLGLQGVVDGINHEARMKYFNMSFGSFMINSCPVHLQTTPICSKLSTSSVFWNWCRVQNIPPSQLFWEIAAIMDKVILKTNTLIVIGASSASKTPVITNPLVMLARFVGRISNSNASSAFASMDCVNVRLISIDEALMVPEAKSSKTLRVERILWLRWSTKLQWRLPAHLWFSQQTQHYGKGPKIRLPPFTTVHPVAMFPCRACRRMDID